MVIDLSRAVNAYFLDDNIDDFELFHAAVAAISTNIELLRFSNCEALLKTLSEKTPHILFIDINLGSIDGIECLRFLKKMPHLSSVPKILMSSTTSQSRVAECMALGCSYFFEKPASFKAIVSEMKMIMEKEWELKDPAAVEENK